MSGFGTHAFCGSCGAHRQRMPFDEKDTFWLHGTPCPACGMHSVMFETAKRERVGRWPWQRGWVDRKGARLYGPEKRSRA